MCRWTGVRDATVQDKCRICLVILKFLGKEITGTENLLEAVGIIIIRLLSNLSEMHEKNFR